MVGINSVVFCIDYTFRFLGNSILGVSLLDLTVIIFCCIWSVGLEIIYE